jgi:hypothetical protein
MTQIAAGTGDNLAVVRGLILVVETRKASRRESQPYVNRRPPTLRRKADRF